MRLYCEKDHPVLQMEKSLKELKEYILIVSKIS